MSRKRGAAPRAAEAEIAAEQAKASSVRVWKPHMVLKRFEDGDPRLTPGAIRARVPYDAKVDRASTGRSSCHVCRQAIAKGALRVALMLQCHKGWKTACFVHVATCFARHPESRKLAAISEIEGLGALTKPELVQLEQALADLHRTTTTVSSAGAAGEVEEEGGVKPHARKRPKTETPGAATASR